ncbi:MAG TPA: hypothetical protein VFY17_01905, partial [Pilimelia sp.]|nr:hypothetical protein [Pilimelia sp.]
MGATVIVGAFTIRPRRPVVEAVELMLERGDDVTLVVLRTTTWQDLAAHPRLTLLGLGELERRHPLRAVPALLLRRGPQAPLRRLIWL